MSAGRVVNVREQYKGLTRRLLLDSAIRVFERTGYTNATVNDIVDEAGVSRATFYLHFENKLELVHAWYAEARPDLEATFPLLTRALLLESRDLLAEWMDALFDYYRHTPVLHAVMGEMSTAHVESRDVFVARQRESLLPLREFLDTVPEEQHELVRSRVSRLTADVWRATRSLQRGEFEVSESELKSDMLVGWSAIFGLPPADCRG
jgi:AcrR family transcriptional regulator